jgi:hypothetical protein
MDRFNLKKLKEVRVKASIGFKFQTESQLSKTSASGIIPTRQCLHSCCLARVICVTIYLYTKHCNKGNETGRYDISKRVFGVQVTEPGEHEL